MEGGEIPQITTFSDRLRLDLATSFTGEDLLYVELEAGNTPFRFDYFEGALSFESDTDNEPYLAWLAYYFPLGERTEVTLQGVYGTFYDYVDTVSVLDGDGGSGALSYFGTRNPIYNTETFTGSTLANFRSFTVDNFDEAASINSDAIAIDVSWAISDRFIVGGWGTYTKIDVLDGQFDGGNLDVWSGALTLAFPDLVTEGSMGGIIVGVEPKVTNSEGIELSDRANTDRDTSFHLEGFY